MTHSNGSWEVMPTAQAKWQGGYSIDLGAGISVAPASSNPLGAAAPQSPTAARQPTQVGGLAGAGQPAAPTGAMRSDVGLLLNIIMYPWILLVGAVVYAVISAPTTILPPGLHLHPLVGIGALVLTLWLYARLLHFLPAALALAVPSALLSGVIAWSLSDRAAFLRLSEGVNWKLVNPPGLWSDFLSHLPVTNPWVLAAILLNIAAHVAYWWDARSTQRLQS